MLEYSQIANNILLLLIHWLVEMGILSPLGYICVVHIVKNPVDLCALAGVSIRIVVQSKTLTMYGQPQVFELFVICEIPLALLRLS